MRLPADSREREGIFRNQLGDARVAIVPGLAENRDEIGEVYALQDHHPALARSRHRLGDRRATVSAQ